MSSKGKPVVHCRVTQELYDELLDIISETNLFRVEEPWTISTFVERAIAEKIAKMKRSRKLRAERYPSRYEVEEFHTDGGPPV